MKTIEQIDSGQNLGNSQPLDPQATHSNGMLEHQGFSTNYLNELGLELIGKGQEAHDLAADVTSLGAAALAGDVEASILTGTPVAATVPNPITAKSLKPKFGFSIGETITFGRHKNESAIAADWQGGDRADDRSSRADARDITGPRRS